LQLVPYRLRQYDPASLINCQSGNHIGILPYQMALLSSAARCSTAPTCRRRSAPVRLEFVSSLLQRRSFLLATFAMPIDTVAALHNNRSNNQSQLEKIYG
jgi:hypothetical protein